jgi:putative transposase
MRKLPPSERISKEISELLEKGYEGSEGMLSVLIKKSVQKVLSKILEEEVKDFLGRDYYQRGEGSARGYRNGYERRSLKTSEGKISLEVPQVRDSEETYRSVLLGRMGHTSANLERLALEMYVRGLSTRDIEEAFKDEEGRLLLSKSSVSEVTDSLAEEYERFTERDLSGFDVVYLFLDAVYENPRSKGTSNEAILCAWAILSGGEKIMLHMELGNKESYECWQGFLRQMIGRGLRMPLLVTSDGAPGLIRAISECFPDSRRQRCIVHKLRNISKKLPDSDRDKMMPKFKAVYYQENREIAMLCATKLVEEYASIYPSAIKCLQEDLDACLTHLDFPEGHRRYIRSTNLLERAFEEEKRRTKIIPHFWGEKSCTKLVYAVLIRASLKWQRIKMKSFDLALLKNIRVLYGWKEEENGFISKSLAA